ncbi:DUF4132 domain-containing protein [Actinacidiphila acididurans]|uniref:DUF4132 domain-containing protein n=1 Tax=Actinacidiphila acididurans TaxID=2784346 RepID=A0ABS2U264_9ACTN|nr:DUF4132 domain-containing protein [Actinacidiphila acididurans]MBM9509683.1 DUF4132 domain-containing protein [Actinacidiphila acididurans]
MGWIETAEGYAVTLDGTKVVCRNAAGRTLRQVPGKLRDDPEVVRLRQLAQWLERHERECLAQADAWLVRSLPVPAALLARVWPDPAWQEALRDLVVAPVAEDGGPDLTRAGFLRDADPARGLGVVDLDGDSVRLSADAVLIPHPVLLQDPADLDDLREFAAELDVTQRVGQLFREVWRRGADVPAAAAALDTYAGGRFEQLRHATARAVQHGYRVRGGYATCQVVEDGRPVEAALWLGDDYPEAEAVTGDLEWRDAGGGRLRLGEVGPVAWSEGERMASLVYAGRVVAEEEEGDR